MSVFLHNLEQTILLILVVLVTVLLVVLDFKSKKIHQMQVDLLNKRYDNDVAAQEAGIKKHDQDSAVLRDQYLRALDYYKKVQK